MDGNLAVDLNQENNSLPSHLVVGLGVSGNSCARFLRRQGIPFAATDSRLQPPLLDQFVRECPGVPTFLGEISPLAIAAAEELIVAPGIPLNTPILQMAMRAGKQIIGDIELFARNADAPVIAISGTNGKSTVTELTGFLAESCGLNVRVGGNLGTPALDLLGMEAESPDLYVLEVSSFQLETTSSLNACVATVLNISPDHMDRYDDISRYRTAKNRVFNGDGIMVLNLDDPAVMAMLRPDRTSITFSLDSREADFFLAAREGEKEFLSMHGQHLLNASELQIKGRHNIANALAALALGHAFGLPMDGMLEALPRYPGMQHRMQWLGEHRGINWFNDSKGTNVGATLAAVTGVDGPVVLIAGGDGKGADFTPLAAIADRLRALVTIGRDGPAIAAVLKNAATVEAAASMEEAVDLAMKLARPGDNIVLSPACASFDMYENFKARGDHFMVIVADRTGGGGK